jgi:hypothetical protein
VVRLAAGAVALASALGLAACSTARRVKSPDSPTTRRLALSCDADRDAPDATVPHEIPTTVSVAPPFGLAFAPHALLVGGPDGAPSAATPSDDAAAAETGGGDLASKSADPTAPLMSFGVNEWYSPSSHQLTGDDDWNTIMLRAVIPFQTGCLQHILRISQPVYTDTPSDSRGIGDNTLFDLLVFKGCGFTYGIGADLTIPWGDDELSSKKWSGGPAAVVMVPTGKWMFGGLVQNYFSFAGDSAAKDVSQSIFQPIAVLGLGGGRTIGLSEFAFVYDWNLKDWTSLPFGLSYAQVVKIGCQPVKFSISADYNFVDKYVAPDWTIRFGVSFLFP